MSAALALQRALRSRLAATPAVTALVPATAILDRNERPAPSPSILLGEAQEIDSGTDLGRRQVRVFHTIHVWKREASLEGVAEICGRIRAALTPARLVLATGFHCADVRVSGIRTLRDPDGATSHGVVTVEALVQEVA